METTPNQEKEQKEVKFFGLNSPNAEFSNFFPCVLNIDEKSYPSVEHFFQSMKFKHDEKYAEEIRNASTALMSKRLGGTRSKKIRSDWDEIKQMIMLKGLRSKFTQHSHLRQCLLDTKDAVLIEDSPYDFYWGIGKTGRGLNWMGKLLMQVRRELGEQISSSRFC